jgi:hypothetical protein
MRRPKRTNAYQDFFSLWKDADPDIPPEASETRVRPLGACLINVH